MNGTYNGPLNFTTRNIPQSPATIAVDPATGDVYWADESWSINFYSPTTGESRKMIFRRNNQEAVFDAAVLDGCIYWTDWIWGSVQRAQLLENGRVRFDVIQDALLWNHSNNFGLVAVDRNTQLGVCTMRL